MGLIIKLGTVPFRWEPSDWSECSTSCDRGTKTRRIKCQQRVSENLILDISDNLCRNARRPRTVAFCNEDLPCVQWKVGNWSRVGLIGHNLCLGCLSCQIILQ